MSALAQDSSGSDKFATPRVSSGGLVTVAFLKARLDEGDDHLGIFMPFINNAIVSLDETSFTGGDIQTLIADEHGIQMPLTTITTLLGRATKLGSIRREAGRYWRNPDVDPPRLSIETETSKITESQIRLAKALRHHAEDRGLVLGSDDAAVALLLDFLDREQVGLLVSTPPVPDSPTKREHAIVAEFLSTGIAQNADLQAAVGEVLQGLVLYHAAFLPDLADVGMNFKNLTVCFDSVLVRQLLGFEGETAQRFMRETLDLLKASGVRCVVFDRSVAEIQRILAMYENKLGTAAGRASIRPVPMARHFLTARYGPSDVRQLSALLEESILSTGLTIERTPSRQREWTRGELALAKRLVDPERPDPKEPRIQHDVDCVAGVNTIRKGHNANRIEDCKAVFATTSGRVIRNTLRWWTEDEQETGVAPIADIRAIANLAWLKKPSIAPTYPLHELVSLCAAVLRPSASTWKRFTQHLERLVAAREITSDEMTAVLISSMSDHLLREAELAGFDEEHDADTLDEVVHRVRESYAEESAREIEALRASHADEISRHRAHRPWQSKGSCRESLRPDDLSLRFSAGARPTRSALGVGPTE
jgi:hypothetical protein